jgi:hydrogenase maturation protease
MSIPVPPLLVLGWGNLSRGDDALGPLCLASMQDALPAHLRDQVEFLDDYQLQIEFALDLAGRERILFVDASLDCAAPFEVRGVQARRDSSISSHALSPEALLQVFADLHGQAAPPATLLAIRGEAFELGEPVTASAQANLQAAVDWGLAWLQQVNRLRKCRHKTFR